jgi:hypothetical protein
LLPYLLLLLLLLVVVVGRMRGHVQTICVCSICSTYCCREVTGVTQLLWQRCCQQCSNVLLLLQRGQRHTLHGGRSSSCGRHLPASLHKQQASLVQQAGG